MKIYRRIIYSIISSVRVRNHTIEIGEKAMET